MEAVIFDFDGVIGDTMYDNYIAWKDAFEPYGFEPDLREYYRLEGMGRYQIAQYFIDTYQLDPAMKNTVVETKEANYKNKNTFRVYDHVLDIFALLQKHNIATAIVTGASRDRISEHLDPAIARQLTALVTADDVRHTKPDPEPYLKAVEKLNKPAGNCIVVENAILGIQAAKAAGCQCYALETTLKELDLAQADRVFASHKELLITFERLLNS